MQAEGSRSSRARGREKDSSSIFFQNQGSILSQASSSYSTAPRDYYVIASSTKSRSSMARRKEETNVLDQMALYNIQGGIAMGQRSNFERSEPSFYSNLRVDLSAQSFGEDELLVPPPKKKSILEEFYGVTTQPLVRKSIPLLGELTGWYDDPHRIEFSDDFQLRARWYLPTPIVGANLLATAFGSPIGVSWFGKRVKVPLGKPETPMEARIRTLRPIREGFYSQIINELSPEEGISYLQMAAETPTIPEEPEYINVITQGISLFSGNSLNGDAEFGLSARTTHRAGFGKEPDFRDGNLIRADVLFRGRLLTMERNGPVLDLSNFDIGITWSQPGTFRQGLRWSISGEGLNLPKDYIDPATGLPKHQLKLFEMGVEFSDR